ncbi:hypothetical protein EBU99_07090 [bacterium]|nr:hypothetical protein [bacterium]
MRNNLPIGTRGLFACVAVAALPFPAFAATYSKCEQSSSTSVDCLPGSSAGFALNSQINLAKASGATSDTYVFNWKVKNCKSRANQLRGQLAILLDNSKSELTTDPDATRAGILNNFIDSYAQRGLQVGNGSDPKIALINYNGRSGIEDPNSKEDNYNAKFTPDNCANQTTFPDAAAYTRWNESREGVKLSICEYLPLRNAEGIASVETLKQFVNFAAASPRGSTDFTYFFKGAATVFSAANTANVGRHVLVITDGLPNVPKNVAASTCRSTPRLSNEAIQSGLIFGQQSEYCVDRQAQAAIQNANAEALKSTFNTINVHHVLYTAYQRAYFDYDENGQPTLNPADFLIENSARTGNGKVKFSYAKDESGLATTLDNMFVKMDANALQYVEVTVQPAGYSYRAVSPNEPGSEFSVKFVGLRSGANTVTVKPVYQDGTSSTATFTVNVGNSTDTGLACSSADDGKTVDGDPIGTPQPKGDGFYPDRKADGSFRDYRNADPANSLSSNEFAVVGDEQGATDLSRLRLQGGTGNCGVVASTLKSNSKINLIMMLAMLALPILALRRRTRRLSKHNAPDVQENV